MSKTPPVPLLKGDRSSNPKEPPAWKSKLGELLEDILIYLIVRFIAWVGWSEHRSTSSNTERPTSTSVAETSTGQKLAPSSASQTMEQIRCTLDQSKTPNSCWYWLTVAILIEDVDPWYAWRHGFQPVLRRKDK